MAEYVEARLPIASPKAQSVNFRHDQSAIKSRRTYVRMVLRQHTPSKLQRLLLQNKSIMVPTKFKVSLGEIAHCGAYSRGVNLRGVNQSTATSRRTYVRMVLRQHTPEKLECFLLHY
jgi:hypothetical protein